MKYINELREGETVIEHYLCKSRQSMKSRNGKTYLSLKLQDKTGIVDAKVWDPKIPPSIRLSIPPLIRLTIPLSIPMCRLLRCPK